MKIDTKDAIKQIRKLAAENPDHTSACNYVNEETNKPECLIGHYLINVAGIPPETFTDPTKRQIVDKDGATTRTTSFNDYGLGDLITEGIVEATNDKGLRWIREVQEIQDQGWSWGEAVKSADQIQCRRDSRAGRYGTT